jgi:rubrerythrin
MASAQKNVQLEISDIIEPEQEEVVIRQLVGVVDEDEEKLREHFRTTDTYVVQNLSKTQARSLTAALKDQDLSIRTIDPIDVESKPDQERVRCPNCGFVLEFADWRCPECYYEFTDYEFSGEDDLSDDQSDQLSEE